MSVIWSSKGPPHLWNLKKEGVNILQNSDFCTFADIDFRGQREYKKMFQIEFSTN